MNFGSTARSVHYNKVGTNSTIANVNTCGTNGNGNDKASNTTVNTYAKTMTKAKTPTRFMDFYPREWRYPVYNE